jgi:antitoxin YefM
MSKHQNILSVSEARASLKDLIERVTNDATPAIITRRGGEPVVMVSLSEWASIQETLHLLDSPANAKRLRAAIEDADSGVDGIMLDEQKMAAFAEDPAKFIDDQA